MTMLAPSLRVALALLVASATTACGEGSSDVGGEGGGGGAGGAGGSAPLPARCESPAPFSVRGPKLLRGVEGAVTCTEEGPRTDVRLEATVIGTQVDGQGNLSWTLSACEPGGIACVPEPYTLELGPVPTVEPPAGTLLDLHFIAERVTLTGPASVLSYCRHRLHAQNLPESYSVPNPVAGDRRVWLAANVGSDFGDASFGIYIGLEADESCGEDASGCPNEGSLSLLDLGDGTLPTWRFVKVPEGEARAFRVPENAPAHGVYRFTNLLSDFVPGDGGSCRPLSANWVEFLEP